MTGAGASERRAPARTAWIRLALSPSTSSSGTLGFLCISALNFEPQLFSHSLNSSSYVTHSTVLAIVEDVVSSPLSGHPVIPTAYARWSRLDIDVVRTRRWPIVASHSPDSRAAMGESPGSIHPLAKHHLRVRRSLTLRTSSHSERNLEHLCGSSGTSTGRRSKLLAK